MAYTATLWLTFLSIILIDLIFLDFICKDKLIHCMSGYKGYSIPDKAYLTLLHSERPKLHTILAFLSEKGLIACKMTTRLKEQDIVLFSALTYLWK